MMEGRKHMSLTIKELRQRRLPPNYKREQERTLPAARSTVYENMVRLYSAVEDSRLKGIDPGLRKNVAILLVAMSRRRDEWALENRGRAEIISYSLLKPGKSGLQRQIAKSYQSLNSGDPVGRKHAAETRELLQYVGAGLGLETPELEVTDAQRENIRAVEKRTGAAWVDFRAAQREAAHAAAGKEQKSAEPEKKSGGPQMSL